MKVVKVVHQRRQCLCDFTPAQKALTHPVGVGGGRFAVAVEEDALHEEEALVGRHALVDEEDEALHLWRVVVVVDGGERKGGRHRSVGGGNGWFHQPIDTNDDDVHSG